MKFNPVQLFIDDFTPYQNLANQESELLMRTIDRGFVEAILPAKPFKPLLYGYETVTYTGVSAVKTFNLADTLGVADNPHLGTSTKSTGEIYVYYSNADNKLGSAMVQDDDGTTPSLANHFALSSDRKSVKIYYDGTNGYIKIFYLLRKGTLTLKVMQPDKSVKRSLFTWKLKHLNEHDYADANKRILMPNGFLLEEKYLYGFYVNAPTIIKTPAISYTDGNFNPSKLQMWVAKAQISQLSQAEKAKVAQYTALLR